MVPRISEEHVYLHGKPTGGKFQEQEGVTNRGEHFAASRNKEGCHSMLNNPGEHSAASYFKDTLDISISLAGTDRTSQYSCIYM